MTYRIKIAASVVTASVTFFAAAKSGYPWNKQPEKDQHTSSPKLPENFKYDGPQRIVR